MRIGTKENNTWDYHFGENHKLEHSIAEKDIGVIIDASLTFDQHICEKIKKGNSLLGQICRTFIFKDKTMMLSLYKSLIRPQLEYGNQVWAPYLIRHICALENVQRRMTKVIPGFKDLSYEDRLRGLNLPTLAYRRLRGDMIELYKIVTGKYDQEITSDMIKFSNLHTRGNMYKIEKNRVRLKIRSNSFFIRTVNNWNSLPNHTVDAPSIRSFERRLDKHWTNHPIKYDHLASTHPPRMPQPQAHGIQELVTEADQA